MAGMNALKKLFEKSKYVTGTGSQRLDDIIEKGQDITAAAEKKFDSALGKIPAMQKKFEPSRSSLKFGAGSNPGDAIGNLNQAGELDPRKREALLKALGITAGVGGIAGGAAILDKKAKDRIKEMNEEERMAFEKMIGYKIK